MNKRFGKLIQIKLASVTLMMAFIFVLRDLLNSDEFGRYAIIFSVVGFAFNPASQSIKNWVAKNENSADLADETSKFLLAATIYLTTSYFILSAYSFISSLSFSISDHLFFIFCGLGLMVTAYLNAINQRGGDPVRFQFVEFVLRLLILIPILIVLDSIYRLSEYKYDLVMYAIALSFSIPVIFYGLKLSSAKRFCRSGVNFNDLIDATKYLFKVSLLMGLSGFLQILPVNYLGWIGSINQAGEYYFNERLAATALLPLMALNMVSARDLSSILGVVGKNKKSEGLFNYYKKYFRVSMPIWFFGLFLILMSMVVDSVELAISEYGVNTTILLVLYFAYFANVIAGPINNAILQLGRQDIMLKNSCLSICVFFTAVAVLGSELLYVSISFLIANFTAKFFLVYRFGKIMELL